MKKVLLAALFAVATLSASAQGTVTFSNVGGGVSAPVSNADGLLGAGFSAQLQLADGTNVGDPAPFLANGFFSGGARTIDGVAAGGSATLQVAILQDGAVIGTSDQFTVNALGGQGAAGPPAPPAALSGLTAFTVGGATPVIPEPSTVLLALVGGAALLFRRRK